MIPQQITTALDQATLQAVLDALPDYALITDAARNIIAANRNLSAEQRLDVERLLAASTGATSQQEWYDADSERWMQASRQSISLDAASGESLTLHMIKDITHEKRIALDLSRSLEQQNGLNLILRAIQTAQNPGQVLEVAVDHVLQISWLGVRTSAAAFLRRGQEIRKVVSRNLSTSVDKGCARVEFGHCLCGQVAESGETIVCAHVDERHHYNYQGMVDHGHVILPLKWQSQILGVLCFYLDAGEELEENRREFLEAVASVVATAIGRLNYQSQLAQSERLSSVGMLAAGVAHEIKNPLGLTLTSVEWLDEDLPPILKHCRTLRERLIEEVGAERAKTLLDDLGELRNDELLQDMAQCARNALDGVLRVRSIVRDLGIYSRADDNRLDRVSLVDVVERAINLAYNEIKYRARVTREFRQIPPILANEERLAQVFLNLLVNAAHAIDKGDPQNNEIRVGLWQEGDKVYAEVEDTGKGIDTADLPYLFEPFFTTKERGAGTGLGLYISHNIVTSLGGQIDVESTLGSGSRFVISLPVAETGLPDTAALTDEQDAKIL